MKKNNKGFTLIELLAVVVILLAISVIALSSIGAAIERNRKRQDDVKIETLRKYAELYYDQHKNTMYENKIYLSDLNLADSELIYANGDPICGYFEVSSNDFVFKEDLSSCHGENINVND